MGEQMGHQKVKELRMQRGWSQSDLSSLSGLSVKTIQRIEHGQGTPSLDTAKAFASVFNRQFSEFLLSPETSAEKCNDSSTSAETALSQKSADVRVNLHHYAKRYWQPAAFAVLLATFSGILTKLYLNVEFLTAIVSELASARISESASGSSPGVAFSTSNIQLGDYSFIDYYGNLAVTDAFLASEGDEDFVRHVTLLELVMLKDTARIVTDWEEYAELNSDISSPVVLGNYLQCYFYSRTPSDSENKNITKLHECIYDVLSDANWKVYPAMDQDLTKLAQRMAMKSPLHKKMMLVGSAQITN